MRITNCSAVALLVAVAACSRAPERLLIPPADAPQATARCLDRNNADYYFAPGQIDKTQDDAFMRREWFPAYLKAAKADALSCGNASETYRLLLMPASRYARIITLAFRKPDWTLESVDFGPDLFQERKADSPPPERSVRVLSQAEFERIRNELTTLDFWREPQYQNGGADDGWALAIEGRSGDKYRVVTKINVHDGYKQFGCTLFELADMTSFGEAVSFDCPRLPNPRSSKIPLP